MGEEDPQKIVQLGYYDELKEKLLEVPTVFLLGPRYTGKTTGVEEARKVLGRLEHIDLQKHEEFQRAQDRVTKGGKGSAVIEGTAYRLAYALRIGGGWMGSEAYWNWLKEKDNEIKKVLKDEKKIVKAELDENDVRNLLDFFRAEKDERKRRQLVRLASLDGQVIIPLLERVVCEHGQKDLEELEKMADSEEKLTGFIERILLIERSSWGSIGKKILDIAAELAKLFQLALPQVAPLAYSLDLTKRIVSIPLGLSSLRLSSEGIYSNIIALREAWRKLPVEKRVVICEEIDEKLGLPPGSSYEFLESWLEGSARQLLEEISRMLTPEFITQLSQIVNKYEDVKKELDKISKELESLRNEIEKVSKAVARVEEFTFIYNSLKDSCKEVCPKLMHPTKDRGIPPPTVFEKDWVGLGIDVVKNTIGGHPLVKSGKFEEYAEKVEKDLREGKVVIITGERGIGKSVLARYVLARLIREDDKLWVVTPKPDEQGQNLPWVLGRQVNELSIKVIFYYDPSLPEVYFGRGIPGSVDESYVKAILEAFEAFEYYKRILGKQGKASALLVIPGDWYKRVQKVLEEYRLDTSLVNLDLRQDDFLRDIIKAYSGCEVIPDELVEDVKKFSSYTLVAKLAGEWLRGKCDKAREEVETALKESEKNAKRFIARYIWKAIFQRNDELARREAIPLLIRAHFGPIPRKFFE
ncbi:MAG: hypothetical protein QW584_04465, partial [Thermofilaceae archaeon]